ncbi:MAG: BMP family ABC transporter substrate-binding protein, partial [Comamonadaceae bacterium]
MSVATAVALAASVSLAACGDDAPDKGADTAKKIDFLPCMVSDAGGFDDKSFNQLGYEGLQEAAKTLNSDFKAVESANDQDYAPNLESLVAQGCDAIVTVGFALSAATVESAKANPDIEYILIDDAADNDFDGKKDAENIKPILYNTAEAAFLAGYAAADYSKTGTVGTYGGQPFPTVTIFMDGFKQGIEYYNKEKGKNIKLVGWEGNDKGTFTGGFDANEKATNTAKQILDQGADVILPVGGPIYQGALTAIADSKKDVALVGVDADFFETDP